MKTLWACGACRSFNLWRDAQVAINDRDSVSTFDSVVCGDCGYDGHNHYKAEVDDDFEVPWDELMPTEIGNLEYL